MAKKNSILITCLKVVGVIVVVLVGLTTLLRHLQTAELSKEEVRHLLRGVQLPEALNPYAVRVWYGNSDGMVTLYMRIRVKRDQADEILDIWLQEVDRMSSDDARTREVALKGCVGYWGTRLLPLRDDDILAFKNLEKVWDAIFVLRKRDAWVDIYCCLENVPPSYVSEESLSVLYKGQGFKCGPGTWCERSLGSFGPD